jgi:hypothetical protein
MRLADACVASVAAAALSCASPPAGFQASHPDGGIQDAASTDGTLLSDVSLVGDDGPGLLGDSGPEKTVTALAISPSQASIEVLNGALASQQFQVTATYSDGTTGPLSALPDWSSDQPALGKISSTGDYTTTGTLGGTTTVTATFGTLKATATLLVKLHYIENQAQLPSNVTGPLAAATSPDPVVKWAYPYDGTVFPKGINQSTLQWIGGNASDYYYIDVDGPTFQLEAYASAPNQQWDFTISDWNQFLDSTSGLAELKVARWNGANASVLVDEHLTVANGSMRGTIYYAAYSASGGAQLGRVLRIQPGATVYDDFLDAGATCTACHSVSANGGTLIYNAGYWPPEVSNSYDLKGQTMLFSGFLNPGPDGGASQWAMAGLSADGTVLTENFTALRGPIGVQLGGFNPATGNALSNTGITTPLGMPVFSPDNLLLVYVDPTTNDLRAADWDPVNKVASNDRLLVASAANATAKQIQYPTVSPDHQWVVYGRGPSLGSLGVPGDLYMTSVATPGEVELNTLNGTNYPFAEGARDLHLNYEPTFAPVAAGGYFWLVFHSRRTYGNKQLNAAYVEPGVGVKQLWIAAFDQAPAANTDPSHAPFYLGGQDPTALNARGFWALKPCLPNGQSCQTGTDCCTGYCDEPGDGGEGGTADGGLFCGQASGCSSDGSRCTTTADCCNATSGTTCINNVCSEPPPSSSQ